MKTSHTPGPWEITLDARNALGFIRPATPELATPIATIHYADSGAPCANARLIAAAPELLDALQAMLTAFSLDNIGITSRMARLQAMQSARAAIAKAESRATN